MPVAPAASAQVTIANLTDHAWRIVLHPLPAGGPGNVQILSVAARATESFRLVPGDYAIEQGIAGAAEDSWGRRRFTANFAARERYEWSLATARAFGAGEAAARTEGSP